MYRRKRILGTQPIEACNHSGERDEYWEERILGMQQLEGYQYTGGRDEHTGKCVHELP